MRPTTLKTGLFMVCLGQMLSGPAQAQLEKFTESGGYWIEYTRHLSAIHEILSPGSIDASQIAAAERECESAKSDLDRIRPILDRAYDRLEDVQQGILGPIRQSVDSLFDQLVAFEPAHGAMCAYYNSEVRNWSMGQTNTLELRSAIQRLNSTAAPIERNLNDLRAQLLAAGDLLDREGQYLNRAVPPLTDATTDDFSEFLVVSGELVSQSEKLSYSDAEDAAEVAENLIEDLIDNFESGANYLNSGTLFEPFLQSVRNALRAAERVEDELEDLRDALGSSSSSRDDNIRSAAREFNKVGQTLVAEVADVAAVMETSTEFHNEQFLALEDVCNSCD